MLLFGGYGQLGTAIRDTYHGPVIAPARSECDITGDHVAEVIRVATPEIVVNCAAFHNVDQCERDLASAFATNAIAVDRLSDVCAQRGILFVTVSSDYVFSGLQGRPYREDDLPGPMTAYGASKLAGEYLAARHGSKSLIIRTSGVYGTTGTSSKGYTLIEKVLAQAERGEPTRMVNDVTFSPAYAPDVARAILALIDRNARGIHHVANAGLCTWYEFVQTAFLKANMSGAILQPVAYSDLGSPTKRPMYSPLVNTTFSALGIDAMRPWSEALDEFLAARQTRIAASRTQGAT